MLDELDNQQIEENTVEPEITVAPLENEHATRFGMSFLGNIPTYKHSGNSALINTDRRNPTTGENVNLMYFPRMVLMPFRDIMADVPAETPAGHTSSGAYAAHSRPFDPNTAESSGGNYIKRIAKSAAACANLCREQYKQAGFEVYNSLTGIGDGLPKQEENKLAQEVFELVLPLSNREIFPRRARQILGESFMSPFLDEVLDYLQSNAARERIGNAPEKYRGVALALYGEVLAHARNANTIAKGQVATTEAQLTSNPQQKTSYDMRDTQLQNAPEPFDLVCLVHLSAKPKDERALENARKLQETSNEPLKDVVSALKEAVQVMGQNQPMPQPVQTGMSAEDIAALVNKMFEERMAAAAPARIEPTEPEKPEDAKEVPAKTSNKK